MNLFILAWIIVMVTGTFVYTSNDFFIAVQLSDIKKQQSI